MTRWPWIGLVILGMTTRVNAQILPVAPEIMSVPEKKGPAGGTSWLMDGYLGIISVQDQILQDDAAKTPEISGEAEVVNAAPEIKWGPPAVEDAKVIMGTSLGSWLEGYGMRMFGWTNMGYTYSSTGSRLLNVEPRENRFGNEFLLNQLALVLEKPLKQEDSWNFGFRIEGYSGADAALLRPEGGFTTTNPRFGADFRQLYLSAHMPILSEGGVDVKAGRQYTIVGYESAMAPYRPFYSNAYQWFYAEDGAWTGILTNWHVNKQLDILNGVTMGANTFFTLRDHSPCYIGQVNYWTSEDKKTQLTASCQAGPEAIFSAPGKLGDFWTTVELRMHHQWNPYLTQIIQNNMGWQTNTPGVGTGQFYGLYTILICQLAPKLDLNTRLEWYDDVNATTTGFATNYGELTLGLGIHPNPYMRLRPEVRWDTAGEPVFGSGNGQNKNQLTVGLEVLLQF